MGEHLAGIDAASLIAGLGLSVVSILLLSLFALILSSYVKIVTVLSIVRIGLGVRSLPSALVTGGLALVLSFFVMYPTLQKAGNAMDAQLKGKAASDQQRAKALNKGLGVWKKFLQAHVHPEELERFATVAHQLNHSVEDKGSEAQLEALKSSWQVLAPVFMVSELKEAFATGLSLFLPFLVIDLLIANVLVAVGLQQMNPAFVSFPFKLLLFVLVDGWSLITINLVSTYLA